jgi:tetratricopeptide (TPR) repeat protein
LATTAEIDAATSQAAQAGAPENLRAEYAEMLLNGERDYVWHAMRLGYRAMHEGQPALAARLFDEAIRRVEALQAGAEQAERTKSKFVGEEEKWFKGEAHERAALYFYRALLYAQSGDFENAAASARRVQLQDISSKQETQGDWYSAMWLEAWCVQRAGRLSDSAEILRRASALAAKRGQPLAPSPDGNVLVVIETGQGPSKYRGGQAGERLYYSGGNDATARVKITANGISFGPTTACEDIYFQATTRGDRKIDHILAGKAEFKEDTDNAATGAIIAGAGVAATSRSGAQSLVGLGLIVGGLITKGVSAATTPEADIRAWDNLPQGIFLASLKLPAAPQTLTLEALDQNGKSLKQISQTINVTPTPTTVWLKLP